MGRLLSFLAMGIVALNFQSHALAKAPLHKLQVYQKTPQELLEKVYGAHVDKEKDGTWKVFLHSELPLGDDYIKAIMGTKDKPGALRKLGKISSLSIYDSDVTSVGLELIAELQDLEELILSGTTVSTKGMKAVAKLRKLKSLMPGRDVTNEGLEHLVDHPNIEWLDLQTCSITDAGVEHLHKLPQLKYLDISNQNIKAPGLMKLQGIKSLEHLHMRSAGLKDADLAAFSGIASLKTLCLDFNDELTGSGFEKITGLDSLETLAIYQVPFDGENLKHLTRFAKLKRLHLFGIQHRFVLNDFLVLAELKSLEKLVVGESRQDQKAEAQLRAAMPKLELKYLGE